MADVLSIIRDYTLNKKDIIEKDDDVIFGDFAYPKSAKTNYIIWGTNRPDSGKDYYTLECVLYLLRNVKLNHAQYVRHAASAGVPVVRLPDRKDLLNYLTGKIATSDKIDKSAPLDMTAQRPVAAKRPAADGPPSEVSTAGVPAEPSVDMDASGAEGSTSAGVAAAAAAAAADGADSSLAKRPRLLLASAIGDSAVGVGEPLDTAEAAAAAAAEQQLAVQRALKERERLQAKLDETAGRPAVLPQLLESSSLRQVMSLEKIHALRAKRRVKIRDSIKPDEGGAAASQAGALTDAASVAAATTLGAAASATAASAAPGTFFSDDLGLLRELVSRERVHRNRNTCMQAAGKNFADTVLNGVLRAVRSREEGAANAAAAAAAASNPHHNRAAGSHHPHQQQQQQQPSRPNQPIQHVAYSRYDQEKFANRDEAADYFKINTSRWGIDVLGRTPGGGAGDSGVSPAAAAAGGGTGPGALRPTDPRRFMQQKQLGGPVLPGSRTPNSNNSVGGVPVSPASTPGSGGGTGQQQKRTSRTPIIIIPATASLISMLNAKDILLERRFVSNDDKRAAGARRENEALIQRMRSDGTTVPFRVVDQPQKLTPDEWQRVVAVFVQGPAWQFKNWPIGAGNPVEIFARVKAFHLKFSDLPTDPNVLKWNVTVLQLDRHKRHLDRAVLQQFWDDLDLYMRKYKSNLRF